MIPGQSREALGIELMPIALVYISLSALATLRATHSERGVSRDRLVRFFFGELSAGLMFAGGLGCSCTLSEGPIWWQRASSSVC